MSIDLPKLEERLKRSDIWKWRSDQHSVLDRLRNWNSAVRRLAHPTSRTVLKVLEKLHDEEENDAIAELLAFLKGLETAFEKEPEALAAVKETVETYERYELVFRSRRSLLIGASATAALLALQGLSTLDVSKKVPEEAACTLLSLRARNLLANDAKFAERVPIISEEAGLKKNAAAFKAWSAAILPQLRAERGMPPELLLRQIGAYSAFLSEGIKVEKGELLWKGTGEDGQVLLLPSPWPKFRCFLTAHHVVKAEIERSRSKKWGNPGIEVGLNGEQEKRMGIKTQRLLLTAPNVDLAIGFDFLNAQKETYVPSLREGVQWGDPLLCMSSPVKSNEQRPPVKLRVLASNRTFILAMQVGGDRILDGHSGAPIIGLDGRIVGVLSGCYERKDGMTYPIVIVISARHVLDLFEHLKGL